MSGASGSSGSTFGSEVRTVSGSSAGLTSEAVVVASVGVVVDLDFEVGVVVDLDFEVGEVFTFFDCLGFSEVVVAGSLSKLK